MPLYEFLRLAIEKLESSQQKPCSIDPSSEKENDLFGKSITYDAICNSPISVEIPSSVAPNAQLLVKEGRELFLDGRTKNISLDTFLKTDKILIQNNTIDSIRALDGKRSVASSFVSSGNSADRISYEQKHYTVRDNGDSECQSDELQNESVGLKKLTPAEGGSGSKRRRVAEIHNLSERRRRDRINQKMHALQELIPNCNKVDKASMLDEAIEYLKNLKHQVQIMSMGHGLCVAPLMFPPGTRHMYYAPIPHSPVFHVPSHFPPWGLVNCQGIPGPNPPIHGHPRPRLNRTDFFPLTKSHQTSVMVPSHNQVACTSSELNSEDLVTNKNLQSVEASSSINCTSSQLQTKNEVRNQSPIARERNRAAEAVMTNGAAETNEEAGSD